MTKKELRKISLQYRTLSSQMLKIDSQEEVNYIQMLLFFVMKIASITKHQKQTV